MNKMKRIFSFLLVLSMILGSFGATFTVANAAEVEKADKELTKVPKDVIGTEYEKAISRLVAFGIIEGYPDGTFKPANEVTRAEFAKILIEALGIGNATKAATGNTKFSDVPAYHWASGYVNVASGQGLIKGYNDGTFQPEKKVSYAEALTMLVRALGYQDNFLKGTWPGNYVAKAAEAGITAGVRFDSAVSAANRGNVAVLVNNTLDGDVVKVETYKDGTVEYKETDVTLLKDKLDISKYEDTRVIADKIVNDGLDADEITVKFLKDIDKKETKSVRKDYKEGDEKDFRIAKNVNPRKLIGEEVSVYMDNKDKVVYIEVENDDKAYFDYVSEIPTGKDGEIEEISLVRFDKDYKFDKEATVYVFDSKDDKYVELSVDKNGIDAKLDNVAGHVGKFVVKNNKIVYAEIMDSSEALPWMLVRENKKGLLEGINQTTEDFDLDLSKDGNYDGVLVFDTLGNKLSVEDIKEGNIVYAQKQEYDGDDYAVVVVVQDNAVDGKLSKVKNDRVTLGDKQIKVVQYNLDGKKYQAYYSVEGFEEVKEWTGKDSDDWATDMEDADEETMTAYLDAAGRIAFLTTKTKATSGYKYGVVIKAYSDNDRVKIYTYADKKDGEEITYRVEKEKSLSNPILLDKYGVEIKKDGKLVKRDTEIKDGDIVKFKLNKAGEIAEDELYVMDPTNTWVMRENKDFGKDSIPSRLYDDKDEAKSFAIDDKAVIIDAEGLKLNEKRTGFVKGFDSDDFSISEWKDMAENKYDKELEYYVFTKRNNNVDVDAVIFIGKGASTSSDEEAVYVIDKWTKGGDVYVKYASYETGKVEERQVDKLDKSSNVKFGDVKKERPFIAKTKSSGKIELFTDKLGDLTYVSGVVTEKDGSIIKIGNDKVEYKLSTSAIVYEEDVKKTTSNIRKGDAVFFIAENKVNIRVIERLIDDEADEVKNGGGSTKPQDPEKGIVSYVNEDRIYIDGTKYTLNNDSVLYDTDGKSMLAVGGKEIAKKLGANAVVKDVKTSKDVVTSLVLVKGAADAEADRNAAKAVDNQIAALKIADETNPTLVERTAITNARNAYKALTKAQQALVKNLADLEKLEAIIEKVDGPGKAEEAAVKAVTDAVDENDVNKFMVALSNSLFKGVETANKDAYWAAKSNFKTSVTVINAEIAKVNAEQEEKAAVKAVAEAVTKTQFINALKHDLFKDAYKSDKADAYWAARDDFKAVATVKNVTDALEVVNNKDAVTAELNAAKAAVEAATYELNKAEHDEESKAEKAVKEKVNGLTEVNGKGFTVTIEEGSFEKAQDGVADGSYEFKVKLAKSGQNVITKVIKVTIAQ